MAARVAAATQTAQSQSNPCAPIAPFYWEVGDRDGAQASGSVNAAGDSTTVTAGTVMAIASASKWIYAAYVVQKQSGALSDADVKYLTFRSGYTNFSECLQGQTVAQCASYQANGVHSDASDGFFDYGGGHMQNHANQVMGLGPLFDAGLQREIQSQIGTDITLLYTQPQLAGGVATSADDYARFLRKLLDGQLQLGALLGSHSVCTNPSTCSLALYTPIPTSESWHYSLGHWVEDDPAVGDGAFSSAGTFGFYPWIDASKTWYGVLARRGMSSGEGYDSAACGRLIRKAWVTGAAL